jgi:hypothetical protein
VRCGNCEVPISIFDARCVSCGVRTAPRKWRTVLVGCATLTAIGAVVAVVLADW